MCHNKAHPMKNMTKLVIFDLDGTLLDTMDDIADACNHALSACGCPERNKSEYNQLVGKGIGNLFRGALPEERKTEEMVSMMHSHFVPYYNEHICDKTRPYEGIDRMLDTLEANGIRLAIASNKYQEGTELLVRKQLAGHDFTSIFGQREGKPIKPDPEIIHEITKAAGVDIDETIYCGDSDVDMQTGINAGIRTIGVTWGFRTRDELESYSPWMLVDSPEEISEAIMQENKI